MSTTKTNPSKAPVKVQAVPKAPAKTRAKSPAMPAAKAKAPVKGQTSSWEAMLARVEAVRTAQRGDGHFDCFGRATQGYCDQGGCHHHPECLSVSRMHHAL